MTGVAVATIPATVRRPVFAWLAAATLLPGLVVVASAAAGAMPPVSLVGLLFGAAHVYTTFGLYADPDLRPFLRAHPVRTVWVPLGLIVGGAVVAALASPWLLAYLLGGFVCWQIHHFTKQNLGMVSFWCKANGLAGSDQLERRLIVATGVAGMCGMARFVGAYAHGTIPAAGVLYPAGAMLLAIVGVLLVGRATPGRRLPLLAVALFFAPLFLFPNNFEAAVMGFVAAHGAQYYLMVGHLIGGRRWLGWVTVWTALAGYLLAQVASTGLLFGAVVGVTMAHFVVDAGMWRMRDPERRAYISRRFSFLRS